MLPSHPLLLPSHHLNLSPHNADGFNPQCPFGALHTDPPPPCWHRPQLDKYQTIQIFKFQNQGMRFSSGGALRQEYIGFGGWSPCLGFTALPPQTAELVSNCLRRNSNVRLSTLAAALAGKRLWQSLTHFSAETLCTLCKHRCLTSIQLNLV